MVLCILILEFEWQKGFGRRIESMDGQYTHDDMQMEYDVTQGRCDFIKNN